MKRFGLIGRRLGHSYSQGYFGQKFAELGMRGFSYELFELESVEGLKGWVLDEGLSGFNVTVPYKIAVIPQLDALDEVAAAVGAVNCVTIERGRLVGHNTDAQAFQQTLGDGEVKECEKAFILGTGGAARAVAYALGQMGIGYTFVSRHPELHPGAIGYDDLSFSNFEFSILINATPVGMYPDVDAMPLPDNFQLSTFNFQFVYDLIYNPSPTRLLREAAAQGIMVKDGLEMLHLQADLSWETWRIDE